MGLKIKLKKETISKLTVKVKVHLRLSQISVCMRQICKSKSKHRSMPEETATFSYNKGIIVIRQSISLILLFSQSRAKHKFIHRLVGIKNSILRHQFIIPDKILNKTKIFRLLAETICRQVYFQRRISILNVIKFNL